MVQAITVQRCDEYGKCTKNTIFLKKTNSFYPKIKKQNEKKHISVKRRYNLMVNEIMAIVGTFLLAVFAGTIRFINKRKQDISIKELVLNAFTALLSGMMVYFLTADFDFFKTHQMFQAGLVSLSGYAAPETLKLLEMIWLEKLQKVKKDEK